MEVAGVRVLGLSPVEEGRQLGETLRSRCWGVGVGVCHCDWERGGVIWSGEDDPRDPKPSPSGIIFRSIPVSEGVCVNS